MTLVLVQFGWRHDRPRPSGSSTHRGANSSSSVEFWPRVISAIGKLELYGLNDSSKEPSSPRGVKAYLVRKLSYPEHSKLKRRGLESFVCEQTVPCLTIVSNFDERATGSTRRMNILIIEDKAVAQ